MIPTIFSKQGQVLNYEKLGPFRKIQAKIRGKKIKEREALKTEFNSLITRYNANPSQNYASRAILEKKLLNQASQGKLSLIWIGENIEAYRKMAEKADKQSSNKIKMTTNEAREYVNTFHFLKKLEKAAESAPKKRTIFKRL